MIQNTHKLYRYQEPGNPKSISNHNSTASSHMSRLPPNVNKAQLKEIILAKYRKDFGKNSPKIKNIEEIIDSHLEKVRYLEDEVFQAIKKEIFEKYGASTKPVLRTKSEIHAELKSMSQTPQPAKKAQRKSLLPDINSKQRRGSNNVQVSDLQNKSKLYEIKKKNVEEDIQPLTDRYQSEKVELQQKNKKSDLRDIIKTEKSTQNLDRPYNTESISKQLEQIKQKSQVALDMERLKMNEDSDSVRSLYEVNQGDEWTAIIKKDTEKFEQENQMKKQIKKEQQIKMKLELDKQIKQHQSQLHKQKKDSKLKDSLMNQVALDQYNQEQFEKKQKYMKLISQMQDQREKQIEMYTEKQKLKKTNEDDINRSIVDKANQSYQDHVEAKKRKRVAEYQFYQKVKEDDEMYKNTLAQSIDRTDPQNIFTQKNYTKINATQLNAYNPKRKANNVSITDHFEKNKQLRIKDQENRRNIIEQQVTPLAKNFKIVDQEQEKEETKKYYQNIFKANDQAIQQEEVTRFEKKMKIRQEINRDLDKQLEEIQNKKDNEKMAKFNFSQVQSQNNNDFEARQRQRLQEKRERNAELQEYLRVQAEEQKKKQKRDNKNE